MGTENQNVADESVELKKQEVSKMIGMNVKAKRESLKISQIDLCKKGQISLASLQRIENGKILPNIRSLLFLAEALGCGLVDLVQFQGNQ